MRTGYDDEVDDRSGGREGNGYEAMHGGGESAMERAAVTKRMEGVPLVSTILEEMLMRGNVWEEEDVRNTDAGKL